MTDTNFDGIIDPAAGWADIPQLSTEALALGGTGGPMNAQAVALAKRLKYLNENKTDKSDSIGLRAYFERVCAEIGLTLAAGSFEEGATITSSSQALLYLAGKEIFTWGGTLNKTVAADSTPETSGGIGAGAWVDRTEDRLRSDLISASGSSLVSFFVEGSGYSPRSVKNKLMESISVLDYMSSQEINDVKNRIGSVDLTASIQTAILENYKGRFPPGKYFINSTLYTRSKNWLQGAGITDTEIVLGPNGYIRNIGESKSEKSQNVTITDMSIISEVQYGAKLIYEWCEQITLDHVLFYHCAVDWVHHFWGSISNCIFYSSRNTFTYPDVGDNGVSGAPKISNCFFDDSEIYMEDTVDVMISKSSFFNGSRGLTCKINNWTPSGVAEIGFPVFISDCVFDSINNGEPIHIENAAWVKLNGVFVSGGRSANASGIYIYKSKNINLSGVTCYFCGDYGLVVDDCDAGSIVGGSFGANKNGGVKVLNSNAKFIGVDFESGINPEIYGGSYIQPIGINDVSSSSEILVIGSYFDDEMTTKAYAPNGKFKGNSGINDSVDSCTTATRPASSSISDGFEIYDKTLRKKIIFDQVYNAWRDMSGVIV